MRSADVIFILLLAGLNIFYIAWREKYPACFDGKVASNSDQDGTANHLK